MATKATKAAPKVDTFNPEDFGYIKPQGAYGFKKVVNEQDCWITSFGEGKYQFFSYMTDSDIYNYTSGVVYVPNAEVAKILIETFESAL